MIDERPRAGGLTRRQMLGTALAAPLTRAWRQLPGLGAPPFVTALEQSKSYVVGMPGADVSQVEIERSWHGGVCSARLTMHGSRPVALKEAVVCEAVLDLPPSTPIYGESFQMLSQTGGTLGAPMDLGSYTDVKHYRIPMPDGTFTLFGAMAMMPPGQPAVALGFDSTERFIGAFRVRPPNLLQVVVDLEGLAFTGSVTLEPFRVEVAGSRDAVLRDVAKARAGTGQHVRRWSSPPTGWCSWYCFGAGVTAQNILDNLDVIAKKIPGLTYVQIDDGYQPAMGDWLETGPAFGGDVRKVLDAIKARGFQPAIWVAPFVAEQQSHVFQQHPDWFVTDADGSPLRSDKVTFGGWRRGPWYVLDGTHPGVQAHFEHVFGTMNRDWGVTYFKLDANFWGAIHGGRFHDPNATRIEAYRRGMAAIVRGAGRSFILGCNHPIWPSAGLVHGSRSSNDIKRSWDRIKSTAQQNLLRNWQNGRLWWNDPDAVCLTGDLPENEIVFHATTIYATGGMVLSGDDLTRIPDNRLAMLRTLLPPTGVAAVFDDDTMRVGRVTLDGRVMLCLFNPEDAPVTVSARLADVSRVRDVWSDRPLGRLQTVTLTLPPHSARLLECLRG